MTDLLQDLLELLASLCLWLAQAAACLAILLLPLLAAEWAAGQLRTALSHLF